MKRIIIAMSMLLTVLTSQGQMTLEHSYNGTLTSDMGFRIINLELSGYKILVDDVANDEVRLYNLNHTIWKTIKITLPAGYTDWSSAYVTEKLFNTDNNVELLVSIWGNTHQKVLLINESGSTLQTIDSASIDLDVPHVQTVGNNTYKLLVQCGNNKWCVYALPGTIPCDKCGNGLGLGKPGKVTTSGNISNPAPNPSKAQTTVEYTLPIGATSGIIDVYNINGQKVKTYKVDNTFNSLLIDNTELNSGTYYYYLNANGERSETKKMVVIK